MRPLPAAVLAAVLAAPGWAADPPKPADPGPPEFEAKFADDSTLKVVLLDPTVSVTTRYGKLVLPAADIRRVELGFRYPPGVEAKAEAAAGDLGSPSFRTREDAEKTLIGLGEYAAPAVRRARKSHDPEAAKRADAVWKKLADKLPPEKLDAKDYDLVEAEFPVRGKLDPTALKVRSKYFGESDLRMAEVRGLRSLSLASGPTALALDAAKYGRQNWQAWLDTGVEVTTDGPLEVTCTGQIDLNPQQPGQFPATPMGNPNVGVSNPIPVAVVNGAFGRVAGGQRFTPGTVIGRIGTDGPPFMVGAAYRAPKGPGTGRLFLIVAPGPWGVDSVGEYQIKVKAGG